MATRTIFLNEPRQEEERDTFEPLDLCVPCCLCTFFVFFTRAKNGPSLAGMSTEEQDLKHKSTRKME